jgi:hypothetical protein
MAINPFDCPQRDRLFKSMKLTWYNLCPIEGDTGIPIVDQQVPYALYHCHPVSQQIIAEIKQASELVGQVFWDVWSIENGRNHRHPIYVVSPRMGDL